MDYSILAGKKMIPGLTLLLSALIKAEPAQNFKLNILYENMNKNNKHPAEYQGNMTYPLKSFADIENLVRLSL